MIKVKMLSLHKAYFYGRLWRTLSFPLPDPCYPTPAPCYCPTPCCTLLYDSGKVLSETYDTRRRLVPTVA